ncbi:SCO family protein [Thalassomonas viridans]|uniref:SCO family protein n=1 Tax=Thalassomonas viridans TaxID=137584 RepID=A0AAE9Z889_9GAMM|nr:SCO family protein [Thalassomonas viridans]WDE07880.1 SCO family protein [Thalassomonas viridans]
MIKYYLFIPLLLSLCYFSPQAGAQDDWPEMSLFHLPGDWRNHHNQKIRLAAFAGKPVLAAMVYTSCQHACPMITAKMTSIRKRIPLPLHDEITCLLISLDPGRDTPDALLAYKNKRKLDHNWSLITADQTSVRQLAAVLGVNYKEMPNGDFSHANIISLIDANGVVISQLDGLNKDVTQISKQLTGLLPDSG